MYYGRVSCENLRAILQLMSKTTIQLDKSTRDELRDYQLPDESANDTVKRLMNESEPPQMGIDASEAERIAERVFERKARDVR